MPVYHNMKEQFYDLVKNSEDISDELKSILSEDGSMFYEVCEKFADIGINAPKSREKGSLSVQGVFQFKDIDAAKKAAIELIKKYGMTDEVLDAIHQFHGYAVSWEKSKQSHGMIMDYNSHIGTYINFAELPDEQWDTIKKEIIDELQS